MVDVRWLLVLLLGPAAVLSAAAATYRCHGADGKVTYADRPCDAGQQTVATLGAKAKAAPPAPAASAASAFNLRTAAPGATQR
jgi:hypothetical protein